MRLEVRMVFVLMGAVLVSAGLLGLVFGVTAPVIAAQKEAARQEALAMLLPEADSFRADTVVIEGDTGVVYHAYDEKGARIGLVFTVAPKSYTGPIETMVGVRADSTISAIRIASAAEGLKETPGLGARVLEQWFREQFQGLRHDDLYLAKEDGKIDAVTAATRSSNAVTSGVRKGVERHLPYLVEMAEREMIAQGYVGEFKVIVRLDENGRIAEVVIPGEGFNETEGFGSRCRERKFLSLFKGLGSTDEVKAIDVVSGATVTSEAIREAVAKVFAL